MFVGFFLIYYNSKNKNCFIFKWNCYMLYKLVYYYICKKNVFLNEFYGRGVLKHPFLVLSLTAV